MRRAFAIAVIASLPLSALAEPDAMKRRDAFVAMWSAISRPAFETKESFVDVLPDSPGELEISYAKSRGILNDEAAFRPDDDVSLGDALTWLFRTRNVEDDPADVNLATMTGILLRYPIAHAEFVSDFSASVSEENVMNMMRLLDGQLATEDHEVSLYAEKFHGKGTAFGETFDMNALTAAHRSFPHNTLVKVTNVENGKSVIVRINDRGPYVEGRDMDLSLASFTSIAERSRGKIRATFQRLGDASLANVDECTEKDSVQQRRIGGGVSLTRGVPVASSLGKTMIIDSEKSFVVRGVRYPDGVFVRMQDFVLPGERFELKPSVKGEYVFTVGSPGGKIRTMTMNVTECE